MNKALFFLIISALPLMVAYFIEVYYSAHPCILCVYQRILFFISLGISIIFYKVNHKSLLFLIIITFVLNICVAIYHIGVENHIFYSKCEIRGDITDVTKMTEELLKNDLTSCTDKFIILGLSMPEWNLIYCGSCLLLYFILRGYKSGIFFR